MEVVIFIVSLRLVYRSVVSMSGIGSHSCVVILPKTVLHQRTTSQGFIILISLL